MPSTPDTVLVDTYDKLHACLKDVESIPTPASVAVDLEGVDLGRHGRISIMQLHAQRSNTVWLIDVTTLGARAFDEACSRGKTLRGLLEGLHIRKVSRFLVLATRELQAKFEIYIEPTQVFWDLRHDSDALFSHYDIGLKNAYDLQILELVVRRSQGAKVKYLRGLGPTMQHYRLASASWTRIKEKGDSLFAPEKGGSYEVFEKRPLDPRLVQYCMHDVAFIFELETAMRGRLPRSINDWEAFIIRESAARVALSQTVSFDGNGRHMALASVKW